MQSTQMTKAMAETRSQLMDKRVRYVDANMFVPSGLDKDRIGAKGIERYLQEINRKIK